MSENLSKYTQCFVNAFELTDQDNVTELVYQSIENWDSVGHMSLMSELEDTFDIVLEMDEINEEIAKLSENCEIE